MPPVATANPYLAIDRLATIRRSMAALAAQEAMLAQSVALLPDGVHAGIACAVEVRTVADGSRRVVVVNDALAQGPMPDPDGDIVIAPMQMS